MLHQHLSEQFTLGTHTTRSLYIIFPPIPFISLLISSGERKRKKKISSDTLTAVRAFKNRRGVTSFGIQLALI